MSKASEALAARDEARDALRDLLEPGDAVTVVYVGAKSQDNQRFRVLIATPPRIDDGKPAIRDVTWLVAGAIGSKLNFEGSITMGGSGYSKAFQIVYSLGRALYPDGVPCTGDSLTCRSNDHANGLREYDTTTIHSDSGYAFTSRSF